MSRAPGALALAGVPAPALILAAMVSRQLGAATAKPLFDEIGPLGVTSLRLGFSALILLVVWRSALRLDRRLLPWVLACGSVLAGMNIAFYQALDRIPLGPTVAIELLGPLALAVFGSRRATDVLWALLAGAGVLLLTESGRLDWAGVAFALVAAGCWVGYILLGAHLSKNTGDGSGLALAMVWGTLVALPFGLSDAGGALGDTRVLVAGAVLALASSVLPYSLEFRALRRLPTRVFSLLMSLEPAVAALTGYVVLSERLSAGQWTGLGCVVVASLGVVALSRDRRPPDKPLDGPHTAADPSDVSVTADRR